MSVVNAKRSEVKLRVVVIGGGIVGVCCAWQLLKDGHNVVLIDRVAPGAGCSFGNACMISPDAVVPIASPASANEILKWTMAADGPISIRWSALPSVLPWLMRWAACGSDDRIRRTSAAMAELHKPSLALYRSMLADIKASDLVKTSGQLQVSRRANAFTTTPLARELREALDVRTEIIAARELRELVPALASEFVAGLFFPNNGQTISSVRLVKTIAEDFSRNGGEILHAHVRALRTEDGRISGVSLDQTVLDADLFVLAAGIGSRVLLKTVGLDVPLQAERGYHLTLKSAGIDIGFPISNRDDGFAVTPMEDGIRLAGTVEIARERSSPNWKRVDMLARQATRMFPQLKASDGSRWMGSRPSLPDGLPILGPSQKFSNLSFAFGNGHYGMTAAPMMAKVISAIISRQPSPVDLGPVAPDRFDS